MDSSNLRLPRPGMTAVRIACVIVLAAALSSGCKASCRQGQVLRDGLCHNAQDTALDGGDDQADSSDQGSSTAGTGSLTQGVSAADTNGKRSTTPAVDPTVDWMCMKNGAGECTSCNQDADCPSHVCERGYCMDCRDVSHCGAADSCISNRCVPERKPASVWGTAGGGQTVALGFKLQVSVGVPAPAATTNAPGFKLSVAPGAGSF